MKKKAIIFSAHPDDHLCCAGTLMFLKDLKFEILEVVATGGEMGPWWISEKKQKEKFKREKLKKERKKEISQASKIIGIKNTIFLDLPDSKVQRDLGAIEKMVEIIRKEKPQIIFGMNEKDYHPDHREFSKMTLEAAEKASWNYLLEKGKPWRVPIVLLMEGFYFGRAHFVLDITSYLKKKQKVIEVYKSQINPRERKLLESMNFYRAFFTREEKSLAAECFEIPKNWPVDLKKLLQVFKN